MSLHSLINTEPWVESALCGGNVSPELDPETFYPLGAQYAHAMYQREADAAKAICHNCAVEVQCLDYALRADERHGVWGGYTETERQRLKRRKTHD